MSIVAGVDFRTLSVRVSLFDKREGRLGSGVAFVASGDYACVDEAQDALCPPFATYLPDAPAARIGHVLPTLRKIASEIPERK